ncbi:MAG: RIP metalloprotease RseP [Planctomycetota bacterium]
MAFGSILLAAIGIGLLIFVHEAGHFLAARLAGVRVERFSLGFGPRVWGFWWRGTDFRLSLVPFGGYVMVAGQDPSDRRYPARESLWAKSVGQRTLFWSGGVLMNLLVALVAFPIVFHVGVDFQAPVVGRVVTGGAAWEAGVRVGERIVSVDGKAIRAFENLVVEVALTGGRTANLVLRGPDGDERTVAVEPQWNADDGRYELGIDAAAVKKPPSLAITPGSPAAKAGLQTGDLLVAIDDVAVTGAPDDAALAPLGAEKESAFRVAAKRGEQAITATVTPVPAKEPGPLRVGVQLLSRQVAGIQRGEPFLDRLGLRAGDVLLAIDERPFVQGELSPAKSGPDRLRLRVRRDGAEVVLEQPATAAERAAFVAKVALKPDDSGLLLPMPGLAAAAAGMLPGDRIVQVDGKAIATFDDLRRVVERSDNRPLAIRVQRVAPGAAVAVDPATHELALLASAEFTITPRRVAVFESGLLPELMTLTEEVRAESFGEALWLGTSLSLDMIKQLYLTLKRMVTGDVGAKNLGGIIRISQVSYQAANRGFTWFLYLMAMLSLNLAFVNLLPIPVLDGGHLLFLLIEKVKGSPVSGRVFGYSQVVGLVFVLMLVLFVTYNDILQLL